MNREEIFDFVRRHPTSYMATVDGVEPRVRGMQTAHINEDGLTFCTGVHKSVYKQLTDNPRVELLYWSPEAGLQLRLRGRMSQLDSLDLKMWIVQEVFTFLKPVVEKHGYESLGLFRLESGEYKIWNCNNGGSEEAGAF